MEPFIVCETERIFRVASVLHEFDAIFAKNSDGEVISCVVDPEKSQGAIEDGYRCFSYGAEKKFTSDPIFGCYVIERYVDLKLKLLLGPLSLFRSIIDLCHEKQIEEVDSDKSIDIAVKFIKDGASYKFNTWSLGIKPYTLEEQVLIASARKMDVRFSTPEEVSYVLSQTPYRIKDTPEDYQHLEKVMDHIIL